MTLIGRDRLDEASAAASLSGRWRAMLSQHPLIASLAAGQQVIDLDADMPAAGVTGTLALALTEVVDAELLQARLEQARQVLRAGGLLVCVVAQAALAAADGLADGRAVGFWRINPDGSLSRCLGIDASATAMLLVIGVMDGVPAASGARLKQAEQREGELRDRAGTLILRLLDLERQRMLAARQSEQMLRDLREAREQLASGGGGVGLPRDRHDWPLRDFPDIKPDQRTLYCRRPDDVVLQEIEVGKVFMRRFGLDGTEPAFSDCVAALDAVKPVEALCAPGSAELPELSIVIPVYAQLAWTLNAIDSLIRHRSRHRFEIIVVDDLSPDDSGIHLPRIRHIHYHRQPANGGFIVSCNTGAAMARGRYVMMLNNDTRLVDGCLDELLESFALFPQAGMIGSKLYNDDATLQEAGGIIWRDGSAWNLGRNDDPNRPIYCHARKIDYISGCAIVLPTALWRQLGGFDPLYRPAYAEDADLAFRVRAAGYDTMLQPLSRIIHYEGKSSGRDVTRGVKAYQIHNQRKFYRRWRETLMRHRPNGSEPLLEAERDAGRRAMVIDAVMPTPTQDAGSVTTTLTLKLYQQLGYKAILVPEANFLYDPENTPLLHRQGVETAYAPFDLDFEKTLAKHAARLDVVQVYCVSVLERVLEPLRRIAPHVPVLFHNMDLHYLRMERQAELEDSDALREAAADMKRRELDLISRVDCTITHSTHERDLLAVEAPGAPVVVWPFMFELMGTEVPFDERRGYAFLGGYRHAPNVDAVRYFVESILPLLRQRDPEALFYIVGASPGPEVLELAGDNVIVTGMIDDLRDVLDKVRVFVCPLRIGAGVKGKVSVAMSYGLPVVTTGMGVEGMEVVEGDHFLQGDDAESFAEAAFRAHEDAALWQRLSLAGLDMVAQKHSLEMGRQVLAQAIDVALDKHYAAVTPPDLDAAIAGRRQRQPAPGSGLR